MAMSIIMALGGIFGAFWLGLVVGLCRLAKTPFLRIPALVFNEIMATTQGGPNNSSQVLGTWLYQSAFKNDDMGYATVIAVVIFVFTFTAALLQLAYSRLRRVEQ